MFVAWCRPVLSMLAVRSLVVLSVSFCEVPCMLIWKGMDVCLMGLPSGVIAWTRPTLDPEQRLCDLVDHEEVGGILRSWSLSTIRT